MIRRVHKIVLSQPYLGWIKALEQFDKLESIKFQEYLVKFHGIILIDPDDRARCFTKLNEYRIKRYSDVFTENLPNRLPHPNSLITALFLTMRISPSIVVTTGCQLATGTS